jgi:hypothetical protein
MGVPTSEVGYTSATAGRGDHEVHKGHVVALGGGVYMDMWWYWEGSIYGHVVVLGGECI